jgi:hypothetical protein
VYGIKIVYSIQVLKRKALTWQKQKQNHPGR